MGRSKSARVFCRVVLVSLMQVLIVSCTRDTYQGLTGAIYTSRHGFDDMKCGSQVTPCKSISMAVKQAGNWANLIYIDGADTDTDPYTCENVTSQHDGVFVNKSISLVGHHTPVYVKCREGMSLTFEADDKTLNMMINIEHIRFERSWLRFVDCSVTIDNCSFMEGSQPINVTQDTHSIKLSIMNSVCANTSSCFAVFMKGNHPTSVGVDITNTIVTGMHGEYQPTPTSTGTALYVAMETGLVKSESTSADIDLRNVTFTDCLFGGLYGLLYVSIPKGNAKLDFDNVTLKEMHEPHNSTANSIIKVKNITQLSILVNNSMCINNSNTHCFYIGHHTKSTVQIMNSLFIDNHNSFEHVTVLWLSSLDSENVIDIKSSTFVRNTVALFGYGINLECKVLHVDIEDCIFNNNDAAHRGGMIYANAMGLLEADVKNSQFLENKHGAIILVGGTNIVSITNITLIGNTAQESVGIIFCDGNILNVTIANSLVSDNIIAGAGGGGVITLGWAYTMAIAKIDISNTVFRSSAANEWQGVISIEMLFQHLQTSISIRDCVFEFTEPSNISGNNIQGRAISLAPGQVTQIHVINTSFIGCLKGYTSAVYIDKEYGGKLDAIFTGCTFRDNHALQGSAGAIYITTAAEANITFKSCTFASNTSPLGEGGAVIINAHGDEVLDSGCIKPGDSHTVKYRKWKYKTITKFVDSNFGGNTAQSAGAVSLSGGKTIFRGCNFTNNFATIQGGHIWMGGDSTSVEIFDSKFSQTKTRDKIISFISTKSAGPLLVNNTIFSYSNAVGGLYTVVRVSTGGLVKFSNNTSVSCPQGNNLEVLNFTNRISTQSGTCILIVTSLQFNCRSCATGLYSLQRGQSQGLHVLGEVECLECPFGADCSSNFIKAHKSFWGYKVKDDPPELNFTACPVNYCETPKAESLNYNACQGNRTGTLCGTCKDRYTETLISPVCRITADCNDTWLLGVAVIFSLCMALYLITKPPLVSFLLRHILWFKRGHDKSDVTPNVSTGVTDSITTGEEIPSIASCVTSSVTSDCTSSATAAGDNGYLKVMFYFYQVGTLLLISASFSTLAKSVLQPVLGLFNFQLQISTDGLLCIPLPGIMAVTKELLMAAQVFTVLGAVILWYLTHRALCALTSRPRPTTGPYLGAAIETLLLGYAVLVSASLKLLYCVSIATECRIFIAGEVTCYTWWQYALIVVVCTSVVPFVFVLAYIPRCLSKGTITARQLIIACTLPLPFLIYRLMGFLCGFSQPSRDPPVWTRSVERVLYGPFRDQTVYWESILIGRRLILIALHVTIADALTRQLSLTLVCVAILLHHSLVRPFRDSKANATESTSLFCLVVIGMLNVLVASFMSLGQEPRGTFRSLIQASEWIELSLFMIVPVLFMVTIVAAIISQVLLLLYGIISLVIHCHGNRSKERQPLLVATDCR